MESARQLTMSHPLGESASPRSGEEPEASAEAAGTPEERALDEYLEAALRGEPVDLDEFCARRGDTSGQLRRRLEAFRGLARGRERAETDAAASRAAAEPGLPYERLGDFRLLRRLGEGGMGVVFLAEQEPLGRLVALKVLRPERVGSSEAEARFLREARAAGSLRHPGIVAVHAAGEDRGVPYLAMDLVPGRGLDEILRDAAHPGRRVALSDALRWTASLARALHAAHEAGLVHRDVKPSNVRITPGGQAVLLDFGLVRGTGDASLTVSRSFHGTPYYAAPEQISDGIGAIDARTDVFSLGVTLYECATGKIPFDGESTEQVFHRILDREPVPPRKVDRTIPRDVETAVLKAIEKEQGRRYASARDFAEDLESILALRPIRARPAGPWARTSKWVRRNRLAAAAVAVALVSVVGLSATVLGGRLSERRSFERTLSAAEGASRAGNFREALALLDRAVALRPDDPRAARARAEAERGRNRGRSDEAVADSRRRLVAYLAARTTFEEHRERVDVAEARFRSEWMTREARAAHLADRDLLARERLGLEQDYAGVEDALHLAARYDSENPSLPGAWAEIYFEKWRQAVSEEDETAEAFFRAKVEEHDRSRRWTGRLAGEGTIALAGSPEGAEVYAFRYEPASRVRPGGERRLVPVPWHPERGLLVAAPEVASERAPEFRPGDVALAVEAVEPDGPVAQAGIRPGDLVVRFDGRGLEEVLLAADIVPGGPAATAGLRPYDRVVALGDAPVRGEDELLRAYYEAPVRGDRVRARFERGTEQIAVDFVRGRRHGESLGARLAGPEFLLDLPAPEPGMVLTFVSDGKLRDLPVPAGTRAGLRASRTAVPLLLRQEDRLGRLPLAPFRAPPGSYLFLFRKEGFEDLRLPVFLDRESKAEARADLLLAGSTPEGFVWIAPGPFLAGGDRDSAGGWPRSTREVPGFWMAKNEVTFGEYLAFLNDSRTLSATAEAGAKGILTRVPRSALGAARFVWMDGAEYRFQIPHDEAADSISWEDADAFRRWRTERAQGSGDSRVYDLPSEEEWEKAARGVDGRSFPWGDTFDWSHCRGDLSLSNAYWRVALPRAVRDESPWGVFDLAGSRAEWCSGPGRYLRTGPTRGGSWDQDQISAFRAASRDSRVVDSAIQNLGFRLVARPAGPQ